MFLSKEQLRKRMLQKFGYFLAVVAMNVVLVLFFALMIAKFS